MSEEGNLGELVIRRGIIHGIELTCAVSNRDQLIIEPWSSERLMMYIEHDGVDRSSVVVDKDMAQALAKALTEMAGQLDD